MNSTIHINSYLYQTNKQNKKKPYKMSHKKVNNSVTGNERHSQSGFEIRNKSKGSPGPLPLKLWGSSLILKGPKTTRHFLLFLFTKFIV